MADGRPVSISSLLEDPFGPFLEEEVFVGLAHFGGTTEQNPLELRGFLLEWGGVITGLTECEKNQTEFDPARDARAPIRFRGTLEIRSLSWLTEKAVNAIEQELRERDLRARKRKTHFARPSNLSLRTLYAESRGFDTGQGRIKVTFEAAKAVAAIYLTSTYAPEGLVIMSAAQKRRYTVKSMHVHTYELSRRYFARWRLLKTLKELLALDADSNNFRNNKTPLPERTPEWFVDLYMKHMAYASEARKYRPHYDSDSDSDLEPGAKGKLIDGREHGLRHVSRAEVLSRIAEHGEWLVAEVNQTNRRWIDTNVWERWLIDVRRMRWEAFKSEGQRWGVWEGDEVPLDEPMDEDLPLPPTKLPQKRKAVNQLSRKRRTPPFAASASRTPSRSRSRHRSNVGDNDLFPQSHYDSSFSVESDIPSRDSTPSPPPLPPPDPDIAARIPSAFFHPPQLGAALRWRCPSPGCLHTIDLLNLTDADLAATVREISEAERGRLRRGKWTVREVWVRDAFGCMVDRHLEGHLDEWGIVVKQINGEWQACWKHPESHKPSDPNRLREVRKDTRRPEFQDVKEEDCG